MTSLKIIQFVLCMDRADYDAMYKITNNYYNKFSNMKTIYYKYDNKINEEFIMDNDNNIFLIKGQESIVPGCLEKTIATFKYFKEMIENERYDYIIRTNVSTIINMDKFFNELEKSPVDYGGGLVMRLNWYDPNNGIRDSAWLGTYFASGTNILFSRAAYLKMLEKIEFINHKIVDDVSIAILFREHIKEFSAKQLKGECFKFVPDLKGDPNSMKDYLNNNQNAIYYRNKNGSRKTDVIQMGQIVDYLLENKKVKMNEA
jgi:hypothetical protein